MSTMELRKNFYWAGILDPDLEVFDIIMHTDFGTTYNSYLLKGSEKTALFETAKEKWADEYIAQLKTLINIEDIDYLIVNHTEPDHAGTAERIIDLNPGIKLVGTPTALSFMKAVSNREFSSIPINDGDVLPLGDKTLEFMIVPNLHWPDTMWTYIREDGILVPCDSFGNHYSHPGILQSTVTDLDNSMRMMKYYYDNIIGPFKPYVLEALEKIKDKSITMICPGHGPVLDQDIPHWIEVYRDWSTEVNPNQHPVVVMPYVAAYGYTKTLADVISDGIRKACPDVEIKAYDMVFADAGEVVGEMYWADGLLFGTPTVLGEALKPIWDLTTSIFAGTHGGKPASAFGAYGWSGEGVPHLIERLHQLNMDVYKEGFRVQFKPSPIQMQQAFDFGYGFGLKAKAHWDAQRSGKPAAAASGGTQAWKCLVCGEVVTGDVPPSACPICGVGPEQFVPVSVASTGFTSTEPLNVVIVGGGVAALTAAEAARERNNAASIEIITNEDLPCYNRPMLTKNILAKPDVLGFITKAPEWYVDNNIAVTFGTAVTAIDNNAKTLTLSDGSSRRFDRLVYATGAESFVPPIPGADQPFVKVIRKVTDIIDIQSLLPQVHDIVMIGGGVLGLEAASEFVKTGRKVTVVEMAPTLMGRQLDQTGSQVLKAAAEAKGVRVITGAKINAIEADGVQLEAEKLPAQLVVLSTGTKANVQVLQNAGASAERFINVNDKMETSLPGIYAAGDVAACNGVSIGIWNQAVEMGRVAGANAVGDDLVYEGITPAVSFTGFGIDLFAMGDTGKKEGEFYKTLEVDDPRTLTYIKLYFLHDVFTGAVVFGETHLSAKIMEAYQSKADCDTTLAMLHGWK